MKNEITIFENPEFGKVRVVEINGEPWFVGKDVAVILGYERPTKAVSDRVDVEDRDEVPIQDSIGRMQRTPIINESGLYSLILSSKLPSVKKFKHWVTNEVLPSIRKTGKYEIKNNSAPAIEKPDSYMIENPIERAKRWIEEQEEKIALENKIKADEPLVEFAKHVTETSDLIDIGMLSKVAKNENINIGRNKLYEWLRDNGYLMSRGIHKNEPYQKWIDKGYFELKEYIYKTAYGENIGFKTYATGKGQIYIIEELRKYFGENN